tara:strand:- start:172 stop:513 length:342 start_codon:yes stop_codon:yes gene_type:complete
LFGRLSQSVQLRRSGAGVFRRAALGAGAARRAKRQIDFTNGRTTASVSRIWDKDGILSSFKSNGFWRQASRFHTKSFSENTPLILIAFFGYSLYPAWGTGFGLSVQYWKSMVK